ncbi:inaD-like protein [Lytechinus pictus]|uniref:inaD-like protein n=1 Tax=Lytechinus pictus TaxID=7653 RepID=UPI0030B9C142
MLYKFSYSYYFYFLCFQRATRITCRSDLELTKQLTDLVDNFTLLDILSKEEQEDVLNQKIDDIKKKNEERARRHQEIEADKKLASSTGSTVTSPPLSTCSSTSSTSSLSHQSPTQTNTNRSANSSPSPASQQRLQGRSQPSLSHQNLPSSGPKQQGQRSDTASPLTFTNQSTSPPDIAARQQQLLEQRSNSSSPFSEAGSIGEKMAEPKRTVSNPSASGRDQSNYEFINIELQNTGRGLGFGLVGSHGIGVVVKTIVPGGAAEQDGRLDSGDIVSQINDINLEGKTRDEVYNILKTTTGMVRLKVKRNLAKSGKVQMKRDVQQARKDKRPVSMNTNL